MVVETDRSPATGTFKVMEDVHKELTEVGGSNVLFTHCHSQI